MAEVVLNEIAFHPISDSSSEEFIELHNTGVVPVNLSGWRFTEGVSFEFPGGAQILAGGYAVIAKDPATFSALYPSAAFPFGPYDGQLDNGGERISLVNGTGGLVDRVAYDDALPWANAADGEGPTLELRNPNLNNALPESWAASDRTVIPTAAWRTLDITLSPVSGEFFFFLADLDGTGWIGDAVSIHILLDEMLLENLAAPGVNLITDGGFETGNGSAWIVEGPLQAQFVSREDSFAGNFCLHHWALESGRPNATRVVYRPTPGVNLSSGNSYRFTCRYRVLQGRALFRVGAGTTAGGPGALVEQRAAWGTPGGPNSVLGPVEIPLLTEIQKLGSPLAPSIPAEVVATFQEVTLLDQVELEFSVQTIGYTGLVPTPDQQVWQSLVLTPDPAPEANVYRGQVPGQSANSILRYRLKWSDTLGGEHCYPPPGSHPENLASFVSGPYPNYGVPSYFLHVDPDYQEFFKTMYYSGFLAPSLQTRGILRPTRPTFPATLVDLEAGRVYEDIVWKPRGWDNLDDALENDFRTGQSIEFHSGDYYRGEKRELDISNNQSRRNSAGVSTRLAHETYRRAGVPVSRTRYIWWFQNGVPMGMMTDLEALDNVFLERWGRDGEGSLYKARWHFRGPFFTNEGLLRANEQVFPFLEDYKGCYLKKNRRNSNHSDLIAMCRALNAPNLVGRVFEMAFNGSQVAEQKAFFESHIDLDNIFAKYGVDHVLANHDRGQQNHFLYPDVSRDGLWETYPWDLDISWDPGNRDLWNTLGKYSASGVISVDEALFTPAFFFYEAEPFFTRLVSVPEFRERYVTGVGNQLRTAFSERRLFEVLDRYEEEGRTAFAQDLATWPGYINVESAAVNYCNANGIPTTDPLHCIIAWFKDRVKRTRQAAIWRARNEDQDGYTIPPVLSDGRTSPLVPTSSDPVTFRVNAISAGVTNTQEGIATVSVHYRLNQGAEQIVNMTRVGTASHDGDYSGQIGAQPNGTVIEYWFTTQDDIGLTDRLPAAGFFATEVVDNQAANKSGIVINEIQYHSDLPGNEWVEILNASGRTVDVSRWILGDSSPEHRFRLPGDLWLTPGALLAIAANEFVVREAYGIDNVVGDFEFNFSNSTDMVQLFDEAGVLVDMVHYDDAAPWPSEADGFGPSIELIDPILDNSDPNSWSASRTPRGTPGKPNGSTAIPAEVGSVVINEFCYDPSDAGVTNDYNNDGFPNETQDEFVEFYNTTGTPINLSGWTIDDDDPLNGNTFVFPEGTFIPANGYLVVFGGGTPAGFSVPTFLGLPRLGNEGDQIHLHDGTKDVDSVSYENGALGTLNDITVSADGGVIARQIDGSPIFESREPFLATVGGPNKINTPTPSPTFTSTPSFTPTPSRTNTPTPTPTRSGPVIDFDSLIVNQIIDQQYASLGARFHSTARVLIFEGASTSPHVAGNQGPEIEVTFLDPGSGLPGTTNFVAFVKPSGIAPGMTVEIRGLDGAPLNQTTSNTIAEERIGFFHDGIARLVCRPPSQGVLAAMDDLEFNNPNAPVNPPTATSTPGGDSTPTPSPTATRTRTPTPTATRINQVIDFDSLIVNQIIDQQYASLGARFHSTARVLIFDGASSTPNVAGNQGPEIQVTFLDPGSGLPGTTTSVAFVKPSGIAPGMTVEIYGTNDALLDQKVSTMIAQERIEFLQEGIARLICRAPSQGILAAMDDLEFTTPVGPAVSPTPSTTRTPNQGPSPTPGGPADYDIYPVPDGDGIVNSADLLEWLKRFGESGSDRGRLFDLSRFWWD